ncbi:MAG TPA: amino acid--tRNA ligase-related protein [Candidatus Babeliales bacterium]|jgi:aspartyl/asparaginyl-tRNA synthetase|nr:amino acid--tRNA ligase-related protein [Candidatus Babeliales bacterium]
MNAKPLQSYYTLESYNETVRLLRTFFISKNFLEVDAQSRRSILAACEDPNTIATYIFDGVKWPLPQTGQMWLEHDLLKNPTVPGLFCLTTSYRNEPDVNPERHLKIFPMFEFETHGTQEDLQRLLEELFEFMGFGPKSNYHQGEYDAIANHYNVSIIGSAEEARIAKDFSSVFFLKNFPARSHPFFNMKQDGMHAKKIDAIVHGIETIGSAERSCNPAEMRHWFYTISDGLYAQKLFAEFGRERVEQELEEFLALPFFARFGGGIGIHRMVRARELQQNRHEIKEPIYRSATFDFGAL